MTGPIDGLRVLDCSTGTAGPQATGLLADYGADVVWVEPPGGDPGRGRRPAAASVENRGKRSIVLDLADDGARQPLLELVDRADVFVESWAPGIAESLGLGYEALHARNPALVYVSISGLGEDVAASAAMSSSRSSPRCWGACPTRSVTVTGPCSSASRSRASVRPTSRSSAASPRSVAAGGRSRPSRAHVAARRRARVPLDALG